MAMTTEHEGRPRVDDPDAVRAEWLGRLDDLVAQVKAWVEPAGWRTRVVSKSTEDSELGRFKVPLLLMECDGVQIVLNPVSRFVAGADGAVDLYLAPAYDKVASLYCEGGAWNLYHESPDRDPGGYQEIEAVPLSGEATLCVLDEFAASET